MEVRAMSILGLSIDVDRGVTRVSGAPELDGLIVDTEAAITNRRGERSDVPVSIDIPMTPPQMRTLAQWLETMARHQERNALKGDSGGSVE
jgi:hypothetical protein